MAKKTLTKIKKVEPVVAVPVKPGHTYGKWIYKPTKSKIYVCDCGTKYLKIRDRQNSCMRCMLAPVR